MEFAVGYQRVGDAVVLNDLRIALLRVRQVSAICIDVAEGGLQRNTLERKRSRVGHR
jgi:hypothetical protein